MRSPGVVVAACLAAAGCTHTQLQRSTLNQIATVSDLRHMQVLDNLARVAANRSALPYFGVIETGTTQIQDQVSPAGSLNWDPHGLTQAALGGLGGSRSIADQWTLDPIKDPDRLMAMQCAYRWALGDPTVACKECDDALKYFKVDTELVKIQPGWFGVGGKKEVPKRACHVGRCGDVYVWVTPEGLDGLTRFTVVIMDIATADKGELAPSPPTQQVQKLHYNDKGQLVCVETYTEPRKDEKDGPASEKSAFQPKLRQPDRFAPPGLMFTPGSNANPLRLR